MKFNYIIKRMLAFLFDYATVNVLASVFITLSSDDLSRQVTEYLTSSGNALVINDELMVLMEKLFEALANDALYLLTLFVVYYVIFAKLMGGRTLGCRLFAQKIVKNDGSNLTYSDLTVRMLFTNLGMMYLIIAVVFTFFGFSTNLAMLLFTLLILTYLGFLVTNVIFLFVTSTTLVDMMTKSKPLIILRQRKI